MKVTIFLCLLYHSVSLGVVIYEYEITKKGYSLTMDVGQPMQRCEKSIDLAINYTWTTPIFYSPKKSSSYSEGPRIDIHLIDPDTLDLYSGTIGYDYFYIRNYKMRLPFFFTKDVSIHRHYSEAFGFAFYFFDEEFSIVHHLYKKKITDDLKFSFTEQKDGKGNVYIGGTPDISSYLYKGNCSVNESYTSWGCNIDKVIMSRYEKGNDKIINVINVNHTYAFFQSSQHMIYVPEKFIMFLVNNTFKEFIKKSYCEYHERFAYNDDGITCNCDVVSKLPNISFVIGGYQYKIEPFYLFQFYDDSLCEFLIASNPYKTVYWMFGYVFFERFVSVFDYKRKEISFYSKLPIIEKYTEKNYEMIRLIYIINFCIMIIYLVYIMLLRYKFNFV